MSNPFLEAAAQLHAAGYHVIPLPAGQKAPPPTGWTGEEGATADTAQILTWAQDGAANIGVRLPRNVVGIDVDAYGDKPGMQTYSELLERLGAPPRTVCLTSRDDTVSGIRLYRLPEGVDYRQLVGGLPGIEVLRWNHRYAVVAPSMHPNGRPYRALDTSTRQPIPMPAVIDLPLLPEAWIAALTPPPRAERVTPVNLTPFAGTDPDGTPCKAMRRAIDEAWSSARSRHDCMTDVQVRVLRLDSQGHAGVTAALFELADAFVSAVTADGTRRDGEAHAEWLRGLDGARQVIDSSPFTGQRGCCGDASTISLPSVSELVGGNVVQNVGAQPPMSVAIAPGVAEQPVRHDVSSWRPVDLEAIFAGTYTPPEPDLYARADGRSMFYRGLLHSVYGESESGKSWWMQHVTATMLEAGQRVAYIDFESDAPSVVNRLRRLGAGVERLRAGLTYIRPETPPRADEDEWLALLASELDLVVVDGVTEALTMWGGESKDNDSITRWLRQFPKQIMWATGAAVVLIDHVAKDKDTRGRFAIGGQAKLAGLDGAAYLVEPTQALAPGAVGVLAIRVSKDRPGGVRSHAGEWRKGDRTQLAATWTMDSTVPGHDIITVVGGADAAKVAGAGDDWRPTAVMEVVSRQLEKAGTLGTEQVVGVVDRRADTVRKALKRLAAEGFASTSPLGARGTSWHFERLYTEAGELAGEWTVPTVPTPSETVPDALDGEDATVRDGWPLRSRATAGTARHHADGMDEQNDQPSRPIDLTLTPCSRCGRRVPATNLLGDICSACDFEDNQ